MCKAPHELWPLQAKAAIFDFDGTLADTADLWHQVDLAFLQARGIPLTPDYPQRLSALGFVEGARYTIDRYGLSETVDQICAEWTRMSRELYQQNVELRPGAEAYIRALRSQGVPCALATTNGADVLQAMRKVDVRSLFDACVYAAEVGRGKDHPDIFLEVATRLGAAPQNCIVFEDIAPALRSARRAAMLTCGVRANDPSQDVAKTRAHADLWLDDWQLIPL